MERTYRRLGWLLATTLILMGAGPVRAQLPAGVLEVGTIADPEIDDSSGLVASRNYRGAFWTHNDGDELLFAIDRSGQTLGRYNIVGVKVKDWQDTGIDDSGFLYIADVGNDGTNRIDRAIHRIAEPNPYETGVVEVRKTWIVRFPSAREDCEAFFVCGNNGYLVTRNRDAKKRVQLFRFSLSTKGAPLYLQAVGSVALTSDVTDAEISSDKSRLALLTKQGAYVFLINGNPGSLPRAGFLFTRFENDAMSGCAFAGNGLLVTTENGPMYLFNKPLFRKW